MDTGVLMARSPRSVKVHTKRALEAHSITVAKMETPRALATYVLTIVKARSSSVVEAPTPCALVVP